VSGGLLRKRIEDIMTNPILSKLSLAKRCLLSMAALITIAAPISLGLTGGAGVALAATSSSVEMRRYRNDEWKFELDIPKQWVVIPPVPSNGPEVIRFESKENGYHGLIVWRAANDPSVSPKSMRDEVQKVLAKGGFSNFVPGETSIGSRKVLTLDFDRKNPDGSVWSCRQFYIIDGALQYTLGFGTTGRDAMFDAYDRMAKSFVFEEV
jgi:hypothetical protein